MICPQCGNEIPEGVDECIVCGNIAPWFQNIKLGFPAISTIPHIKEQWLLDGTPQYESSDDTLASNVFLPKLNPVECFAKGWEMYKKHFRVYFIGMLLTTIITCLLRYSWHELIGLINIFHGKAHKIFNLFIPDIPTYISSIFAAGLIVMAFTSLDNQTPVIKDIFRGFKRWPQLLFCYFVMKLIVLLGGCFFIIPGIYLGVCYCFAIPLILERNINFVMAMKLSRRTVHKKWFAVFLLCLLGSILYIPFIISLGYLIYAHMNHPNIWERIFLEFCENINYVTLLVYTIFVVPFLVCVSTYAYTCLFERHNKLP